MTAVPSFLDAYRALAAASAAMRGAAVAGDWDRLLAIEPDYHARVASLAALGEPQAAGEDGKSTATVALIRQVLDDEAAIRAAALSRLAELAGNVGVVRAEAKLRQNYERAR